MPGLVEKARLAGRVELGVPGMCLGPAAKEALERRILVGHGHPAQTDLS